MNVHYVYGEYDLAFKCGSLNSGTRFKALLKTTFAVGCVSLLAACSTTSAKPTIGSGIFRKANASASYIDALNGGLLAKSGQSLGRNDTQLALLAEYRALEDTPVGVSVPWGSNSTRGVVVANAPYQVGNQNCRQYSHVLTLDGREFKARGAACRNSDGSWTPLT